MANDDDDDDNSDDDIGKAAGGSSSGLNYDSDEKFDEESGAQNGSSTWEVVQVVRLGQPPTSSLSRAQVECDFLELGKLIKELR